MSVDAWGKLWEKAVGLAGHSAVLQLEEDCGRVTVVWPDGSRIGLVFDNGDWHRCDATTGATGQAPSVESAGIDDQIRKLLEDIRDNYEPELIAYENAIMALALLDTKAKPKTDRVVDHPMSGAL